MGSRAVITARLISWWLFNLPLQELVFLLHAIVLPPDVILVGEDFGAVLG